MRRALRHLFSGRDNTTIDMGRVSWALCFVAIGADSVWHAYADTAPTVTELSTALGAIVLSHGVALFAKRDTEPPGPSKEPPP